MAALSQRLPVRMEVRPRLAARPVAGGAARHPAQPIRLPGGDGRRSVASPPESIVELLDALDALDAGCDMAVGSRYVPGGSVDRVWSLWRFLNSRLATLLTLPLVRCADPMSGFFAIDRRALPDLETLRPIGYKIGLELMVRGGLRVRETPIGFRQRDRGSSKLNWRRQPEFLRHLYRLYTYRFGGPARVLLFGLVGASGLVVEVSCCLVLGLGRDGAPSGAFPVFLAGGDVEPAGQP